MNRQREPLDQVPILILQGRERKSMEAVVRDDAQRFYAARKQVQRAPDLQRSTEIARDGRGFSLEIASSPQSRDPFVPRPDQPA